jgi:hypothetical protein
MGSSYKGRISAQPCRSARRRVLFARAFCTIAIAAAAVAGGAPIPESLDESWWTGPLMAPSAATLPRGHWLLEPYVYDLMTYGHFDPDGALQTSGAAHDFGNQTYIEYGFVDRFTLGLIPRIGLHESSAGEHSSGLTLGDVSLQGAYALTRFDPDGHLPATSLVIGETFPTGRYDRLDASHTDDALGAGAYSTTLALYSQTYFWMANGRILRTRLDLSYSVSRWTSVRGLSVYGTAANFQGQAHPGQSIVGDLAFEYSVTQHWVLASDINWEHDDNTHIAGDYVQPGAVAIRSYWRQNSGSDDLVYLAPGIEYNWSARMGLIAGARIAAVGRNASATVAPVVAINMVF